MKRTLVIGDIHGGLKALYQVFEKANVAVTDKLIFLGDYVDGWSESAPVIDFVMQYNGKQPCIFIKGNHDEWCEDWLRTGQADKTWLMHGGLATVKSYAGMGPPMRAQHLQFFEKMAALHGAR